MSSNSPFQSEKKQTFAHFLNIFSRKLSLRALTFYFSAVPPFSHLRHEHSSKLAFYLFVYWLKQPKKKNSLKFRVAKCFMDTLLKRQIYRDLIGNFMTFFTTFVRKFIQWVCLLFTKENHWKKKVQQNFVYEWSYWWKLSVRLFSKCLQSWWSYWNFNQRLKPHKLCKSWT